MGLWNARARLKVQHASRAACDALPTGDAAAVAHQLCTPGVASDVDAHGTVVGTDATLHAARGIRRHPGAGQGLAATTFLLQKAGYGFQRRAPRTRPNALRACRAKPARGRQALGLASCKVTGRRDVYHSLYVRSPSLTSTASRSTCPGRKGGQGGPRALACGRGARQTSLRGPSHYRRIMNWKMRSELPGSRSCPKSG
jgi:hypothetical protein